MNVVWVIKLVYLVSRIVNSLGPLLIRSFYELEQREREHEREGSTIISFFKITNFSGLNKSFIINCVKIYIYNIIEF